MPTERRYGLTTRSNLDSTAGRARVCGNVYIDSTNGTIALRGPILTYVGKLGDRTVDPSQSGFVHLNNIDSAVINGKQYLGPVINVSCLPSEEEEEEGLLVDNRNGPAVVDSHLEPVAYRSHIPSLPGDLRMRGLHTLRTATAIVKYVGDTSSGQKKQNCRDILLRTITILMPPESGSRRSYRRACIIGLLYLVLTTVLPRYKCGIIWIQAY